MSNSGERELVQPTSSRKTGIKWTNGVAIPQSKTLTQNFTCLKEQQGQTWRRDWGKGGPVTSNFGFISRVDSKAWHYYWCYGVLTDSLAWLSSERTNKQLTETETDSYIIQPLDRSYRPLWWIRERLEEAEKKGGQPHRKTSSLK